MARRRKSGRRSGASRFGSSLTPMNAVIAGAIYGVAETPVMNAIGPMASKLPFGQYNLAVTKAGLSYLLATKLSGIGKNVGLAGLNIVGKEVSSGVLTSGSTQSNNTFY